MAVALLAILATASAAGRASAAACGLDDAKVIFRSEGGVVWHRMEESRGGPRQRLYGCLTGVGLVHRLPGDGRGWRRALARDLFMVKHEWLGMAGRRRSGSSFVAAVNLRSGRRHKAPADEGARIVRLVVNGDGTLAWIAQGGDSRELHSKGRKQARSTLVYSGREIDSFLGLELYGCAITWRLSGEQRSTSIPCDHP